MDQDQKVIHAENPAIVKLTSEIKALEQKIQQGNAPRVRSALWAGAGAALVGGACILGATYGVVDLSALGELPSMATMAAGNLGLALTSAAGGFFFKQGRESAKNNLRKSFIDLLDAKLEALNRAESKQVVNFVFNIDSEFYPEYQRKTDEQVKDDIEARRQNKVVVLPKDKNAILPLNMADYILKLNSIFIAFYQKPVQERPIIETIEIKNAELNDAQFIDLLTFGIGCCGTTTLNLSNNRLTFIAIQELKSYVQTKKQSFHHLRRLDLSNNNLTEECLPALKDIVSYLGIEELNISGNKLNGTKSDPHYNSRFLNDFLWNLGVLMPHLKVLNISNIGLNDNCSKFLNQMLVKPSLLTNLDMTNNPNLGQRKLRRLFEKGYQLNQSLCEIKVDKMETLGVAEFIERKNALFKQMHDMPTQFGDVNAPRIVYLLNRFFLRKQLQQDTTEFLEPELHEKIEELADKIAASRKEVFQLGNPYISPVTELEYTKTRQGFLTYFYQDAIRKNKKEGLDIKLFENEERVKQVQSEGLGHYSTLMDLEEESKSYQVSNRIKTSFKKAI
jgi:hypothetical protein